MAATDTIKRLVKARALRQGLLGGHPLWRAVWVTQFLYKRFAKVSKGGEPPINFDEPLKEGEVWAIVHEPEKTKKGRGEGRKFLIGPKRKAPRANTMTGLALGVVGEKILAAPSAERINQILGESVFEPPEPSKKEQRAAKKLRKADERAIARAERDAAKSAKAARKARAQALRDADKAAKVAEKAARKAQRRATSASETLTTD